MARFFLFWGRGLNKKFKTYLTTNIIILLVFICFTLLVKLKDKCRTGKGQAALMEFFLQVVKSKSSKDNSTLIQPHTGSKLLQQVCTAYFLCYT